MRVETLRWLHSHDRWATERIFACVEQLTDDEFVRSDDTPHGSIRNSLVHAITAHWRWLSWCDGSLSGEEAYALMLNEGDFPDVASVRAKWEEIQEQNRSFLSRMTEDDVERILSVDLPDGRAFWMKVGQVMTHLATHSLQHRTEVAMSLTKLGHSPGDMDFLFYAIEENAKAAS